MIAMQEYNPWKNTGFVKEMVKRVAELETGKVKGYSWEEVKQRARQSSVYHNKRHPKGKYRK